MADTYGTVTDAYYTPFLRIEKGHVSNRGLRDALSPLNQGIPVIPQIIFNTSGEFTALTSELKAAGITHIDLNLGCPFSLQVRKGRGAALLSRPEIINEVMQLIAADNGTTYSVKMRLGIDSPRQWQQIMPILNDTPLEHITIHPRTADQQYGGEINMEQFARIYAATPHPLIYNGDLTTTDSITAISETFPALKGIMAGRGLLGRPSLACEWRSGTTMSRSERLSKIGHLHTRFSELIAPRLCGDSQLLMKLKPFWDYLEDEIGHRNFKAISKARSIESYKAAVAAALS
ncbi:MAG: tRNA-dihydrouridine synthase family protein [Odoribacter sp.]|nr:tRNA-dihydrouridine synthase family protein [Odoribacter sp.]